MTYESSEISVASGRPVELYDIAMGTFHWYLTSAGYDIDYLGKTYESAPCRCSEIKQSGEAVKDAVELQLPRGHAIAVMCIAGAPDEQITLTKYRGHSSFFIKNFIGYMNNFKFDKDSIPTCVFEPASSDMNFIGGRRRAMRLCPYKLYSFRCGVNNEAHKITGTIDTISGLTITASEFGTVATSTPAVYGDLTGLDGCIYTASSLPAGYTASMVFNNQIQYYITRRGDELKVHGSFPDYFICQWTSGQLIKKVVIYKNLENGVFSLFNPRYFRIQGSNNGSVWTDIDVAEWEGDCVFYGGAGGSDTEMLNINGTSWIAVLLDNSDSYTYIRILIYANWGGYITYVPEIEMMEAENQMDQYQFGGGGEIIVGNAHRTIIGHNGTQITIDRPFSAAVIAGSPFTAYAGCNHTPQCCREKFDKIINFGGWQYLPVKNPYIGRSSLVR
jgi:hypothetical protein